MPDTAAPSSIPPSAPAELAASLGQQEVLLADAETARARIRYEASMRMCHSGGVVQGGFIAGWLDAAMAHAAIARLGHAMTPMSLELKVSYFAPAYPGSVIAEGWIEKMGRSTAFGEAQLLNAEGEVIAKATSTIRLVPRDRVEGRARAAVAG